MIEPKILIPERVRAITSGFAFIEHRFLRDGFWNSLSRNELVLYLFLVLAADRNGVSYYSYDKICTLTKTSLDDYIQARDGLIVKGLIAFEGRLFQVLSLPEKPATAMEKSKRRGQDEQNVPMAVGRIISDLFGDRA